MRKILILTFILYYQIAIGQDIQMADSIRVRILNRGKHYIKEYILTIDGNDYQYADIGKKKTFKYQRLPYIWPSNRSKTTVIIKQMFNYDKWITVGKLPIDHVGEEKLTSGFYTIEIRTKRNKDNLDVEEKLTEKNEINY
ncbi:MAG: hypothetical protein U5K79_06055 [Cyclobacteriaceae bacterium]|nr:hypothetical protein [Cyclobacteriaceae bacterium]